jgi:iron-sulfur cluster repair protein YtfE (RIC family)|tara:strand:- start:3811 stop:3984 length:174 start_codon:yes stop_codon:yes gene_type:complete
MMEALRAWLIPEGITQAEKIKRVKKQDDELNAKLAAQFEDFDKELRKKKQCMKSLSE